MVAVFDASVLVKLFLSESGSAWAEHAVHRHRIVNAPDLAHLEVASAITRASRNGTITSDDARRQLAAWRRFAALGNVRFTPISELQPRAEEWSLDLRHPLADCVYLALAEATNVPLITADAPFADKARGRFERLRHLSEFAS